MFDTKKLTLILHPIFRTSFHANYLEPIIFTKFNVVFYDPTTNYEKSTCIFIVNCLGPFDWVMEYYNQGYKIVIDNLWEVPRKNYFLPNCFLLTNKDWFWYNESLCYIARMYHNYIPNKTYQKKALMLIRRSKIERDILVKDIEEYLHEFLYSYIEKGIFIEGDIDNGLQTDQRFFNNLWYDKTHFSLVVETLVSGTNFTTEKTYKPIAFYHPFIIFGQTNVVKNLKNLGFETFDNIFDESYDDVHGVTEKLKCIKKNLDNFVVEPYDKLTLDKLQHNHNLFFDKELVVKKMKNEILDPIVEYAESK